MKAIYAKDIKAMVKKFNLTEDESEYLNDIAEAINKERTDLCEDIQMTLLYGSYSKSKRNAIRALLVYFGAKAQKNKVRSPRFTMSFGAKRMIMPWITCKASKQHTFIT